MNENYKLISVGDVASLGRVVLNETLNLTGAEISLNVLPKNVSVPFVHAHKNNEEIYVILDGKGYLYIDGKEIAIAKGDAFRVDPKGERCIKASEDSSINFMCIQVKADSLDGFTLDDGIITQTKPSWL